MLVYSENSLEIDSCPECFGLWFDGEELKNFIPTQSLADLFIGESQGTDQVAQSPRDPSKKLHCPACQDRQLSESKVGETFVDICLRCRGIWLDRGELSRLVSGFQKGERGNLLVLNQLAEGFRTLRQRQFP